MALETGGSFGRIPGIPHVRQTCRDSGKMSPFPGRAIPVQRPKQNPFLALRKGFLSSPENDSGEPTSETAPGLHLVQVVPLFYHVVHLMHNGDYTPAPQPGKTWKTSSS